MGAPAAEELGDQRPPASYIRRLPGPWANCANPCTAAAASCQTLAAGFATSGPSPGIDVSIPLPRRLLRLYSVPPPSLRVISAVSAVSCDGLQLSVARWEGRTACGTSWGEVCSPWGADSPSQGREGAVNPATHPSVVLLNLYLALKIAVILTHAETPAFGTHCTWLISPRDRKREAGSCLPGGWRGHSRTEPKHTAKQPLIST